MRQLECVLLMSILAATGAITPAGFGGSVAVNTALRKWTITPDADLGGTFSPEGVFHVTASCVGAAGATARVLALTFVGGALVVESIDPATGLAADLTGSLTIAVFRIPSNG